MEFYTIQISSAVCSRDQRGQNRNKNVQQYNHSLDLS